VAIIISKKPKLSFLEIDVDKDWNNKGIYHLDYLIIQPDSYPSVEFKPFRVIFGNKGYDAVYNSTVDRFGNTMEWIYHSLYADDKAFEIGIYKLTNSGGISSYMGYINAGDIQASVSAQSFEMTTLSGLDILIDNNIEAIMPTDSNVTIMGYSQNLFRVENINDAEQHVVDSIYHDDTLNLDIVGTRWAMKVNDNDYHMGIGITHDLTSGNVWSGIASTYNFGMTTTKTSPYEITGIGFGMSGYDGYVRNVDVVLDTGNDVTSIFGIRLRDASFPFLGGDYPDTFSYAKFTIKPGALDDVKMKLYSSKAGKKIELSVGAGAELYLGRDYGYIDITNSQVSPSSNYIRLHAEYHNDIWFESGTSQRHIYAYQDYFSIYGGGSSDVMQIYNFGSFDLNNIPVVNVSSLTGSAIGITTTSGDITLSPAGLINLSQKQAINFVVENYGGEPANAVRGRVIFNTQTGQFEGYNGTSWIQFGGGGGVTKLSQLEIDTDKDWAGHSITNFGNLSGNAISIMSTSGDIILKPASGWVNILSPPDYGIADLTIGDMTLATNAYVDIVTYGTPFSGQVLQTWHTDNGVDTIETVLALGLAFSGIDFRFSGRPVTIRSMDNTITLRSDYNDVILSPGSGFIGLVDNRGLGYTDLYFGLDPNNFYINFYENVNAKSLYTQIIGDTTTHNYFEVYTETDYNGNAYWSDLSVGDGVFITTDRKRIIHLGTDNPNAPLPAFQMQYSYIGIENDLTIKIRADKNLVLSAQTGYTQISSSGDVSIYSDNNILLSPGGNVAIPSDKPLYFDAFTGKTKSLMWNSTNNRFEFSDTVKIGGRGVAVPTWTSSTRPTVPAGEYVIGFNTDTYQFEGYTGSTWVRFGGITKLSELIIDADKDWAGHSITNFGNLSGSAIGITSTSGDITLRPASTYIRVPNGTLIGAINDSGDIYIVPNSIDWDAGVMIRGSTDPEGDRYASLYCSNTGIDARGGNYLVIYATPSGVIAEDGNPGAITIDAELRLNIYTPTLQFGSGGSGTNTVFNSGGLQGFIFNSEQSITLNATNDIVLNPASGNLIVHGLQSGNDPCKILIGDTISGNSEIDIFPDVNDGSIGIQIVNAINNFTIQKRYINIWSDTLYISTNAGLIDMGSTGSGDIYITANNNIYLNGSMANIMCETIMGNTLYMQSILNMQNNNIININSLIGNSISITSTSGNITLNPSSAVDFSKKQSKNHVLEKWTTSTRPTNPVEGQIGYNTDTHQFEGWNGSTWVVLG
jgi:hypothetical protein